jgi:hypothetical protein
MKKVIVLSFDIPLNKASFRTKIWRGLIKLGAENKMRSHWALPFSKENLLEFKRIAKEIKKQGGKVELIVGRVIE